MALSNTLEWNGELIRTALASGRFEVLGGLDVVNGSVAARANAGTAPARIRKEACQERLTDLAGRARDENAH